MPLLFLYCTNTYGDKMMSSFQKTVKKSVFLGGIGVHSGGPVSLQIYPAEADTGIIFRNNKHLQDPIKIGKIVPEEAMHATVLKGRSWGLSTVEHLMAALMGMEIDNAEIIVNGYEVPIFDGSAAPFVHAIQEAELEVLKAARKWITPRKEIMLEKQEGIRLFLSPDAQLYNEKALYMEYSGSFDHPLIGSGIEQGKVTSEYFIKSIAPARTFGFLEQLPFLRSYNLAQGSSLGNTVVLSKEGFVNNIRYKNECMRHKFLDLFGDLALLGYALVGRVSARRTGHNFNRMVIQHYLNNNDEWRVFE